MSAGYRSYEAFWIGGLSAPVHVPPPQPTGSIQLVLPHYPRSKSKTSRHALDIPTRQMRKAETDEETNYLALQIQREDDEITGIIIAVLKCF